MSAYCKLLLELASLTGVGFVGKVETTTKLDLFAFDRGKPKTCIRADRGELLLPSWECFCVRFGYSFIRL